MPEIAVELQGPWKVQFDTIRRGPVEPVTFEILQDWTTSADNRIKYYSGEAVYSIRLPMPNIQEDEADSLDPGI